MRNRLAERILPEAEIHRMLSLELKLWRLARVDQWNSAELSDSENGTVSEMRAVIRAEGMFLWE